MYKLTLLVATLFCIGGQIVVKAQNNALEIDDFMDGHEFVGYLPSNPVVLPNDQIAFQWRRNGDLQDEWYCYNPMSGETERMSLEQTISYPLYGYEESDFQAEIVYENQGNIYSWSLSKRDPQKLVFTSKSSYNPYFQEKDKIIFTQDDGIFQLDRVNGELVQLLQLTKGERYYDRLSRKGLSYQQYELFDIVKNRDEIAHYRKVNSEKRVSFLTPIAYYSEGYLSNIQLTKNLKFAVYTSVNRSERNHTFIHDFMKDDGYAKDVKARPKVGREEDDFKMFVYDFDKEKEVEVLADKLSHLNEMPKYYSNYEKNNYENKGVVFHGPYFNKNGDLAIVEIKSLDNKHRWIVQLDLDDKKFIELEYQHDDAWIAGPGISGWNEVPGNIGWLTDTEFYFHSEESGYSHLYSYNIENGQKKSLTKGSFEIHEARISYDSSKLYISANKAHPGNRNFYSLDLTSRKLNPILEKDGRYDVIWNMAEDQLTYLYSYSNQPTELFTYNLDNGKEERITYSVTERFENYDFRVPEIVTFKAEDGVKVNARLYEPKKKNGAAVIFVHGAGYLQNAHNWWSVYFREYMFHNFLVDRGYTVMDVDYRASEGYGRDFRTGIYRHMGGLDLSDQVDAREFLINEKGIDENRVGIYGGSYGGFITIMALLTEPGKFQCGAAIRSVTDWAHYNHEYTSNILNTPQEDSISYRRSSPIYFAENLEDHLLMLHGVMDDNVQFQDVVRLSQRFIELGKETFDMALYPVEPHGFREPSSWKDEYKRIFNLFEEHLK